MTYCVGMTLDKGLVMMSDTRTNSGVDNISVFRKMFHWCIPGERIISIMTAGNLATTQAVISQPLYTSGLNSSQIRRAAELNTADRLTIDATRRAQ